MEEVRGPLPPPDVKWHRHDREYILSLLERAKLSQRGAAKLLGLNERTMRYYCSGDQETPYPVQYALEVMAHAAESQSVHEAEQPYGAPTTWHDSEQRRISADDDGKIVVGVDRFGSVIAGRIVADGFGAKIMTSTGVDGSLSTSSLRKYVLLESPTMLPSNHSKPACQEGTN